MVQVLMPNGKIVDTMFQAEYHANHPLLKRFSNRVRSAPNGQITMQPWMALAVKHAVLTRLYRAQYGAYDLPAGHPKTIEGCYLTAQHAADAQVYLWDRQVLHNALQPKLPRFTVTEQIMPFDNMLMTYDAPLVMPNDAYISSWCLFAKQDGCILLISDVCDGDNLHHSGTDKLEMVAIDIGKTYPDDFSDDEEQIAIAGVMLKMLSFINSPYTDKNTHRTPRTERKEVERSPAYNATAKEEPYVVTLRRELLEAVERHKSFSSGILGPLRRGHWVSAHIRNQPYPSEGADVTRPIWIPPHLRGDLTNMTNKVYNVTR